MGKHRFYPLHQSPLYKLVSKKRLAILLRTKQEVIKNLVSPANYNEFKTKKGREVQEPKPELKRIHKRLKNLLCCIEPPSYLFSGVRGRSYVNNAAVHKNSNFFLTCDIHKFYPHCRDIYICKSFIKDFKMPYDVAKMLTQLITFKGMIPTGSPVSQILSYFAYSRIFDKIFALAQKEKIKFSLYVDDITFSSEKTIPLFFYRKVKHELKKVGLKLHPEKTRSYRAQQYKKVTGCIISPTGKLLVPNPLREKIVKDIAALNKQDGPKVVKSLMGRIRSAQSIEKGLFNSSLAKLKTMQEH